MKRRYKTKAQSHSIRIPQDLYTLIKESAEANKRNIVSELSLILEKYFYRDTKTELLHEKHKSIDKLSGIIKGLPKANYASTVDERLS